MYLYRAIDSVGDTPAGMFFRNGRHDLRTRQTDDEGDLACKIR